MGVESGSEEGLPEQRVVVLKSLKSFESRSFLFSRLVRLTPGARLPARARRDLTLETDLSIALAVSANAQDALLPWAPCVSSECKS